MYFPRSHINYVIIGVKDKQMPHCYLIFLLKQNDVAVMCPYVISLVIRKKFIVADVYPGVANKNMKNVT